MGVFSSPIGGLRVHTKITPLVFTLTSISRLSLVRFQPFLLEKKWPIVDVDDRRAKADERQKAKVNGERIMLPSK